MKDLDAFKDFLQCVLDSVAQSSCKGAGWERGEEARKKYRRIAELGQEEDFYDFIETNCGNDREVQLTALQYMYGLTGFTEPYIEFLKVRLKQEFSGQEDLFLELNLQDQLISNLFCLGKNLSFRDEWETNEKIARRMQEWFAFSYEKIHKEERQRDFVVVMVSQLLGIIHSPTRLVLEFCRIIQKYLKKRVLIVSNVLKADLELLSQAGVFGRVFNVNYREERGFFKIKYRDESFDGYQLLFEKDNVREIKQFIDKIYRLKPFCVWNMASEPALAVVMKQFTDSVYMWMSQGYPPVNADLIVNYIPVWEEKDKKNKEFLIQNNIKVLETEFLFPYNKPCGTVKRSDIGIPEDAFCIGIIGTRIGSECTDAFLQIIDEAVSRDKEIFVLFLGFLDDVILEFEKRLRDYKNLFERHTSVGARADLIESLRLLDIFVNPPRIGGGNTGAMAMSIGIPVISLKAGDIAAVAGEEFTAETLSDYPELILKYKNDIGFYEKQSRLAEDRILEKTTDDEKLAAIIQKIFDRIEQA